MLDARPVLADPHASREAIALCERELALASDADEALGSRVRALLESGFDEGYPRLEAIARRLALSSRTLKRKLAQNGSSFSAIVGEARHLRARALLYETELDVREIARRLGYENPANFSRAFKHRSGMTPTQYRDAARLDPEDPGDPVR